MKRIATLFTAILVFALAGVAFAADGGKYASTSASGTTWAYAIIPAGAGQAVLTYLNATADNATNKVFIKTVTAPAVVTAQSASGQAVVNFAPTNSNFTVADDDVLIVRKVSTGQYQRVVETSRTASAVTMTGNLDFTLEAGDLVYKAEDIEGIIPVGNATKEIAQPFWIGVAARPMLLELSGASACSINAVLARFE